MAAHQELSWPPVRTFMSAYKENLMAADRLRPKAPTAVVRVSTTADHDAELWMPVSTRFS